MFRIFLRLSERVVLISRNILWIFPFVWTTDFYYGVLLGLRSGIFRLDFCSLSPPGGLISRAWVWSLAKGFCLISGKKKVTFTMAFTRYGRRLAWIPYWSGRVWLTSYVVIGSWGWVQAQKMSLQGQIYFDLARRFALCQWSVGAVRVWRQGVVYILWVINWCGTYALRD